MEGNMVSAVFAINNLHLYYIIGSQQFNKNQPCNLMCLIKILLVLDPNKTCKVKVYL